MYQNYSLFLIIVEQNWFSQALEKFDDYEKKVILNNNISYHNNFLGTPICIIQGNNLDVTVNHAFSSEKYMEEAEILEQRDRIFAEFERELFKDPSKIICETFDD